MSYLISIFYYYTTLFTIIQENKTKVRVKRTTGENEDLVPIVISGILIGKKMEESLKGKWIKAAGQLRSNRILGLDGRKHLNIHLFARSINIYEDEEELTYKNEIYLDGYIVRPPVFRRTYSERRQITDLLIAVNRAYEKSDYLWCIAWGRHAQLTSEFKVGDRVQLYGVFQSRSRPKNDYEGKATTYYEISAVRIQKVED